MPITHAQTQQSHKDLGIGNDRIVVAASDTPAALKVIADYICDGTADQSEINTALGVADSVYLMPGTYLVNASISLASNKNLIGAGRNSTIIKLANSSQGTGISLIVNSDTTNGNAKIRIAHLKLDENSINNISSTVKTVGIEFIKVNDSVFEDLYVFDFVNGANATSAGMRLDTCTRCVVKNCFFEKNHYGGALELTASTENAIIGNVFLQNWGNGIDLNGSSHRNTIEGNLCINNSLYGVRILNSNENTVRGNVCRLNDSGAINIYGGNYNVIAANVSREDGSLQESSGAIEIRGNLAPTYSKRNIVIGNLVVDSWMSGIGVWLNAQENIVKGNYIRGSKWHGISVENACHDNEIVGNYCIENSQELNNTYDNIIILTNSDYNNVQMNTSRQGATANKPRYGLRIDTANCDGNFVTNNDLRSSGVTGNLSNVGTGTVTAAGNRTT